VKTTRDESIDRSSWGSGPWDDEPDRVEWRAHGLPCLMVRVSSHGAWCGYVAVPPGHPVHGQGLDGDVHHDLNVHGGITYAEACSGKVCHVPEPGEPDDVWWLGFDCVHAWDLSPRGGLPRFETYRDVPYVQEQVEGLARQLAEMAS
jgi:hypothetical protein